MKRFLSPALVLLSLLALMPLRAAMILDSPDFDPQEPALAADLRAAYSAHQDGRYREAFVTINKAIETGNPRAWFFLGWLYETGRGTERNPRSAIDAYQKAYDGGNVHAAFRRAHLLLQGDAEERVQAGEVLVELHQTQPGKAGLILGEAYARGLLGAKPDFEEATKWWKSAAAAGESQGLVNLSGLLEGQFGFPEKADIGAAMAHLQDAAELGNAAAMAALGSRYLNGKEEIRDEEKGLIWLKKAADNKIADADLVLGDYQAERRKNFPEARKHYEAAIANGSVAALIRLGQFDQEGLGAEQDFTKALLSFKKAAARGSAEGAHYAASILLKARDEETGAQFTAEGYRFLLAAASQRTRAQVDLALLYLSGRLGVADPVSAAAWFDRAARLGDPIAQNNLAALFESGTGVARSLKSARSLYTLAAQQGHGGATTALGRFYAQGNGVKQNLVYAWAFFSLAAERGDKDGTRLLGELTAQMDEEQLSAARKRLEEMKKPRPKEAAPDAPAADQPAADAPKKP